MTGLLLTLLVSLFSLLGSGIVLAFKSSNKLLHYTFGLVFSVLTMITITDLFPKAFELLNELNNNLLVFILLIISTAFGYIVFNLIDKYLPLKQNDLTSSESTNSSLLNASLLMIIGYVLFNILEGAIIVTISHIDIKTSIIAAFKAGIYNIPMSLFIGSSLYRTNKDKKKLILVIATLSLTSFLGGVIGQILISINVNYIFSGLLLSFASGMLLYIVMAKLLPKVLTSKDINSSFLGVITGIILILITLLI